MWHEDEANALFHHFFDVAREASELDKTFKDSPFGKFVALNPVDSWRQLGKDGPRCLQYNVVDGRLPLCELTIYREGDCYIGAVVMERVALIGQHGLSIDQRLIVVLVVQSRGGGATPADREVRLDAPYVVILLPAVNKEAF